MRQPEVAVERTSFPCALQQTGGRSDPSIHRMVDTLLNDRHPGGGVLVDVGCGGGSLWQQVAHRFDSYIGVDAMRYPEFPPQRHLLLADLNNALPVANHTADVTAAIETIEHLENPRAFFRELRRVTRPGGWIVVSTPNQESWLSKLSFVLKNRYPAFSDANYPAHLTALLEVDLRRAAHACGLESVHVAHSEHGRIPGTATHYPRWWSRLRPRAFSDNVALIARRPPG